MVAASSADGGQIRPAAALADFDGQIKLTIGLNGQSFNSPAEKVHPFLVALVGG
jgi:hypothetical protein